VDALAVETASHLREEPEELDLGAVSPQAGAGLQLTGIRSAAGGGLPSGSASKFSGLFGSDSSSSEEDEDFDDEGDAGRDATLGRPEGEYGDAGSGSSSSGSVGRRRSQKGRRPSTTEAKQRTPLSDDDDDEEEDELSSGFENRLRFGESRGEGPFADPEAEEASSSDEDDMVEIRPRRTS